MKMDFKTWSMNKPMTHYVLSWLEQFVNAYVNDHEDFLFKKCVSQKQALVSVIKIHPMV